jgi:hypothetical protein
MVDQDDALLIGSLWECGPARLYLAALRKDVFNLQPTVDGID